MQRVHVQRQAGLRWADEFDFSFYNRTRFAGLENGVANCYVNSLVQVSPPLLRDSSDSTFLSVHAERPF